MPSNRKVHSVICNSTSVLSMTDFVTTKKKKETQEKRTIKEILFWWYAYRECIYERARVIASLRRVSYTYMPSHLYLPFGMNYFTKVYQNKDNHFIFTHRQRVRYIYIFYLCHSNVYAYTSCVCTLNR